MTMLEYIQTVADKTYIAQALANAYCSGINRFDLEDYEQAVKIYERLLDTEVREARL